MKKILITLLLLLAASTARAQQTTGTISTNGTDCSVDTRCVSMNVQANTNSVVITLDGTFTGTAQFEQLAPGTTTWRALQVINLVGFTASTSSTAVGSFVTTSPNYNAVRVRASALASGSIGITIRGSNNASLTGLIFGSGAGGTIGTVNQGTAGDASANWLVNCVSGCSGGTSDTDDASIATGQSTGLGLSLNQVFDGTVWRRQTVGVAGTAAAQVSTIQGIASMTPVLVTLSGSNSIVNVSGTVSLPTGASTAAKQPALGTAGTASSDVISIQGIASMTALSVTLPAETSKNIGTVRLADGGGTALTALTAGAQRALTVSVVDNAGNQVSSFGGSGGTASAFGATFPTGASSGTAVGFYDGTNMQGARVVDLDTGAGTFYGLGINLVRRASGGPTEIIGQDTMANSLPVVLASNQSAVPVTGTITAVTAITNALPSGTNVIGHVIVDTTSTTAVTQATAANLNATVVNGGTFAVQAAEAGTWNVTVNTALPAGANVIGHVINDSGHIIIDSGSTTAATQATAANLNATVVGTGTFAVQAAESGTWTVQPGNTANTTAWLMKGGLTQNNAAPAALSNLGVLGYVANAVAPTYTETDQVLGSVDLHGATRVLTMDSTGAVITPSTLGTQNTALTIATTTGGILVARASAATPTAVGADDRAQLVWTDLNGRVHTASELAQGSTTSGQVGHLNLGAVTTSSPSYVSGQSSPFSLDTSGSLRVNVVSGSTGNAAASNTGSAIPAQAGYTGINVAGTMRGITGVNYTGTSYAGDVNMAAIAGAAASVNSGVKDAGTLRVVIATDQPALTNKLLVTPDSVALPANQSVNVSQINGVTTLMGNGATGTGSQRVTIASDNTAFAVNATLSAETTKVIGTARILGNAGAIVDGATGAAPPANVLYVGGRTSGATGGFLTGITVCDSDAVVNISTITTTNIITGVSGRKVHICAIDLVTAAANNVAMIDGTTGGTCGTPNGMAGGTTAASGWNFAANGGLTQGSGLGVIMSSTTAANDVCLVTSATTQLSGHIKYAIW